MKMHKVLVVCLSLLLLTGCSSKQDRWAKDPVQVCKNSPVVYIHPLVNTYQQSSLAVLSFQVPQGIRPKYGKRVAALFKDVLVGRRAFPRVIRLDQEFNTSEEAVQSGKQAGVDLVLAGKINHLLEASQYGGGRVEVALRLLHVKSGETVWYVEQAMDQAMDYPEMDMWSRFKGAFNPPAVKRSETGPVVVNMLAQIAYDLSDVMAGAVVVRRN
jgi:hypothetical protein